MKKISRFLSLLALFFLFTNCKSQNTIITYNKLEPSKKHQILINEVKKENEFIIFFDSGFLKDKIQILLDDEKVANDIISTDNILGAAKSYNLPLQSKEIKIFLNEKLKITLDIKKDFPFINIKKKEDKLFIEYRKVPRKYE